MKALVGASEGEARGGPRGRGTAVPDEGLARLVGRGSERAFASLYGRYHQPLYRYCRSLVRNDNDAEDALQSTFTRAFAALQRGQRDAPLRPWLFRIAHNESISLLRRRRSEDELPDTVASVAPSVEHTIETRARLSALVSDLRQLPERQRAALLMRELCGLSHEEVAIALGISAGAARQSVFEARRAMLELSEARVTACDEIQRVVSAGDRRALRGRRVRAHLRNCSGCSEFAAAIPRRRADLLALAPALPLTAASGVWGRISGGASGHTGAGGAAASGAAGKAAGIVVSTKLLAAGAAAVVTVAAGASALMRPHLRSSRAAGGHTSIAPPAPRAGASASTPSRRLAPGLAPPRAATPSPSAGESSSTRAAGRSIRSGARASGVRLGIGPTSPGAAPTSSRRAAAPATGSSTRSASPPSRTGPPGSRSGASPVHGGSPRTGRAGGSPGGGHVSIGRRTQTGPAPGSSDGAGHGPRSSGATSRAPTPPSAGPPAIPGAAAGGPPRSDTGTQLAGTPASAVAGGTPPGSGGAAGSGAAPAVPPAPNFTGAPGSAPAQTPAASTGPGTRR